MSSSHELARWLRSIGSPDALEALSELTDAAVFAVDGDRNVVLWNRGAERLLGFRAEDVLGQHCLKVNRCEPCMRGCGIAEQGTIEDVPLTLFCNDGGNIQVLKSARAFFKPDGTFAGGIEILRPVQNAAPEVREEVPPPPRPEHEDFHGILSADPAMHRVFQVVRNVAETDASVLIRGESGTGKELVARAIHQESSRRDAPFMAVNCAALSPSLLESELFGHVRGAFTGAVRDRKGLFERADGGILFLDEVAELPMELQAKLLRVIQERAFMPVGSTRLVHVDIRLVAATHASLRNAVNEGRFREDLMYRLRVVPLFLPPLRERRSDIELLLWHFIERHNGRGPRKVTRVQPEAMRALLDHPWPGNIRELMNVVQYAFAVGRGPELRLEELPPEFREEGPPGPERMDEAARIKWALAEADGHVGQAADLLGMSRPTFWRKRKRHGLL